MIPKIKINHQIHAKELRVITDMGEVLGVLSLSDALKKAEEFDRESADYPYARATIHLRMGDKAAAQEAARKTLEIAPDFTPAGILLKSTGPRP